MQFPWITICSNEPVSQDSAIENRKYTTLFGQYLTQLRFAVTINPNLTTIEKAMLIQWYTSKEAMFANFPLKKRHVFGQKLRHIIIDCKFFRTPCNMSSFKLLQSPIYYNCYTFSNVSQQSSAVGVQNGLSLIMKGQDVSMYGKYNEISNIDNSAGIRVTIHEPHTIPNLPDNGIDLIPGHSTSVSLVQKNMERLNTPKSKCSPENWIKSNIQGNPNFKGTFYTCTNRCLATYIYQQCGCVPGTMPDIIPADDYFYCLTINGSDPDRIQKSFERTHCQYHQTYALKERNNYPSCFKGCRWNCNEIHYVDHLTQSLWPLDSNVPDFLEKYVLTQVDSPSKLYLDILRHTYNGSLYQKYNKHDVSTFGEGRDITKALFDQTIDATHVLAEFATEIRNRTIIPSIKDDQLNLSSIEQAEIRWVRDSFYRLNVYFREPVVEVHTQVLNYNLADLAAGCGGILGLWVGVSILTIVQFLEFLGNMMNIVFGNMCIPGKNRPKVDVEALASS